MSDKIESYKNAYYRMYQKQPTPDELKNAFPGYADTPKKEIIMPVKKTFNVSKIIDPYLLIRGIGLMISTACIVASIYFTNRFYVTGLGPNMARIISSAMVAFISFAFTGITLISKKRWFIRLMLRVTAIITMLFSMFTTCFSQYEDQGARILEQKSQTIDLQLSTLQDQIKTYSETAEQYKQEIIEIRNNVQELPEKDRIMTNPTYNTLFWQNYRVTENQKKNNIELANARDKLQKYLEDNPNAKETVNRKNIYEVISGFVRIFKPYEVEFIIDIFLALFIDIIAPFGMYIAFVRKED